MQSITPSAVDRTSQRWRSYDKLVGVLSAISDMRTLRPDSNGINHVASISPEAFLSRYYAANEPVVLQSFLKDWPAAQTWSPKYFAERFGEVEVEVMTKLHQHPSYEVDSSQNLRTMNLGCLVELIERNPSSGDMYLVAQNRALQRPELAILRDDLKFDHGIFDLNRTNEKISLWMGPGDTVTPLHYDLQNLLLAQVYGRKRVKLISPLNAGRIYNHRGGYSEVDPDAPDLTRFPLFEKVSVQTVEIEAGDALFLPFGWWHHVRSLSVSISLSIANFAWPNSFAMTE